MKHICNLIAALFIGGIVTGQTNISVNTGALLIKEQTFDFGKIPQGRAVYHDFVVRNTGNDSLRITNVQASCGCTTPEWSLEPIAPGAETKIKVGYNSAAEGPFSKIVVVYYSDKQANLTISGNVYKTPATSAPLNSSISLLKQINQ